MIQLTGEDCRRLGNGIQQRNPVKLPSGPVPSLIGLDVGGSIGTSVFGLKSLNGIITGAVILTSVIVVQVDGQGTVLTTGRKAGYLRIPFAGVITEWTLLADQSGSIVMDVWKDSLVNFPPTVADTITAAAKPTITSATNASGSPTGWITAFTADSVFAFNIDSVTSIQQITLELKVERT